MNRLFVLCALFAVCECTYLNRHYKAGLYEYTVATYPNPLTNAEECYLGNEQGSICDPNLLLTSLHRTALLYFVKYFESVAGMPKVAIAFSSQPISREPRADEPATALYTERTSCMRCDGVAPILLNKWLLNDTKANDNALMILVSNEMVEIARGNSTLLDVDALQLILDNSFHGYEVHRKFDKMIKLLREIFRQSSELLSQQETTTESTTTAQPTTTEPSTTELITEPSTEPSTTTTTQRSTTTTTQPTTQPTTKRSVKSAIGIRGRNHYRRLPQKSDYIYDDLALDY